MGLSRRGGFENVKPNLFSPLTVLLLIAVLFIFFLTASGGNDYLEKTPADREIIKTEFTKENQNKASALRYERIVTGADPIRSILQ